jgi:hypothetical protein
LFKHVQTTVVPNPGRLYFHEFLRLVASYRDQELDRIHKVSHSHTDFLMPVGGGEGKGLCDLLRQLGLLPPLGELKVLLASCGVEDLHGKLDLRQVVMLTRACRQHLRLDGRRSFFFSETEVINFRSLFHHADTAKCGWLPHAGLQKAARSLTRTSRGLHNNNTNQEQQQPPKTTTLTTKH